MKLIDYLIIASILGCMFTGYSGHRLIAVLLLILVVIVASWRFWDRSREKEIARTGCSGELNPKHDHSSTSHGHDSGGDAGGDD
jgi:hypothetical protein